MRITADRLLSCLLAALCVWIITASVRYIGSQDKWSPIDEYAHMDYVGKVGQGLLPRSTDTISDELFRAVAEDTAHSGQKNIHTRLELGLGNYSYEAHHPPVYYCILSVPDLLMKRSGWPVFRRLKVLRLVSYFIFVAGLLLCIPVFNSLKKLGYMIPASYAWGCIAFGLLIATNQRYGLGNNMLSPLMINCCTFFLLQYAAVASLRNLCMFIFMSCMAVFSALSNLLIVPVLGLFMLKMYRKHFSFGSLSAGIGIVAVFAFVFYWWKKITAPDPLLEAYMHAGLSYMIPAGKYGYRIFWKLLLDDMLHLSFIKAHSDITSLLLGLFVLSNGICLLFIRSVFRKNGWLIAAGLLFLVFIAGTFLLNKYVAAVYWDAFRHYSGLIPVLYVACTAFIPVLYTDFITGQAKQE